MLVLNFVSTFKIIFQPMLFTLKGRVQAKDKTVLQLAARGLQTVQKTSSGGIVTFQSSPIIVAK